MFFIFFNICVILQIWILQVGKEVMQTKRDAERENHFQVNKMYDVINTVWHHHILCLKMIFFVLWQIWGCFTWPNKSDQKLVRTWLKTFDNDEHDRNYNNDKLYQLDMTKKYFFNMAEIFLVYISQTSGSQPFLLQVPPPSLFHQLGPALKTLCFCQALEQVLFSY